MIDSTNEFNKAFPNLWQGDFDREEFLAKIEKQVLHKLHYVFQPSRTWSTIVLEFDSTFLATDPMYFYTPYAMAACSQAKKIHWNRSEKVSCGFQLEYYEGPCIKCSNATITESEENWTVCCVMWILVAAALLCVILFSGSLTEQKWAIEIEPHASFLRPNVNRGRDILHEDLTDQPFNQYDCVISIASPESKQWNPPQKGS
jgi:hypothetical protein